MPFELPKEMECERASKALRIAVVYNRLPFPMMRGDQLTVAHLLEFLSTRGHLVDLYTLNEGGELNQRQQDWLSTTCRHVFSFEQGALAKVFGSLSGLIQREPVQVGMFRNSRMRAVLASNIGEEKYDIVYCYYLRASSAVPEKRRLPSTTKSFLAMQLSQTLNTRRVAANETRRTLRRLFFQVESALMERFESRVWRKFDRAVLIGPADVEAVREVSRRRNEPEINNWIFGAHGTDTSRFTAADAAEIVTKRIVFSGSMLYPPNVQAVLWFADEILPKVVDSIPDVEFIIQGRDPVAEVRDLASRPGVTVTGTVPDVGEIIRSAGVCVNPMRAAGGMQNKLIEYMASAKAVVATRIANEGIQAPPSTFIEANDPREFASAVVSLLSDPQAARELGARAREYVLANWTWEKHFLALESAFIDSLDDGSDNDLSVGSEAPAAQ